MPSPNNPRSENVLNKPKQGHCYTTKLVFQTFRRRIPWWTYAGAHSMPLKPAGSMGDFPSTTPVVVQQTTIRSMQPRSILGWVSLQLTCCPCPPRGMFPHPMAAVHSFSRSLCSLEIVGPLCVDWKSSWRLLLGGLLVVTKDTSISRFTIAEVLVELEWFYISTYLHIDTYLHKDQNVSM